MENIILFIVNFLNIILDAAIMYCVCYLAMTKVLDKYNGKRK